MINVGGIKVFPLEVEAVLEAHPSVAACRVRSAGADARLGEQVLAEVELRAGVVARERGAARAGRVVRAGGWRPLKRSGAHRPASLSLARTCQRQGPALSGVRASAAACARRGPAMAGVIIRLAIRQAIMPMVSMVPTPESRGWRA